MNPQQKQDFSFELSKKQTCFFTIKVVKKAVPSNEWRGRGFSVDVGQVGINTLDFNGKKLRKNLEVDFVCNQGYKRYYIQSAYSIPDKEKMNQETESLRKIGDSFKKIVVVNDRTFTYQNDDGILIMNILDFLSDENSLAKE